MNENTYKELTKENLIIAYGSERLTLNKGEEHMTITNEEAVFLIESLLKNVPFRFEIPNR